MKKFILFFFAMVLGYTTGMAREIVFDAAVNPGVNEYDEGTGNYTTADQSVTIGGVTIASPATIWYNVDPTKNQYRIYKGKDLTITSTAGPILKIEFTCIASGTTKYGPGCFAALDGYTYEDNIGVWTGEAEELVFHSESNQVRASKIVVTLADKEGEVDFEKSNVAAVAEEASETIEAGKWYVVKQHRGGVSPIYDKDGSVYRASSDDVVVAGADAADLVNYLVQFIPAGENDVYNIQFANGRYFADGTEAANSTPVTTTEEEPGLFNVKYILNTPGHFGIYAYDMGAVIDNNGKGNSVVYWGSGEISDKVDGNNDFKIYEVEFAAKSQAAADLKALVEEVEAAYTANNAVVEVGKGIITSTDQFSSPYTCGQDMEPGSGLENLLDMDGSTYWHSDWSSVVENHVHYLQVEFTEPISGEFEFNMNRRVNKGGMCANDNPVKMSVETSLDGEEFVLADEFDTPFTQTGAAPLVQATISIPTPAKYLRFFNDGSNGGNNRGYWHCGDLQLKPILVPAPNAAHAEAAAAFAEAIAAAKAAGANATDADVAALQAAYEAYVAALGATPVDPEPAALTFEFTDNEDGTITITPSDNERTYFFTIFSDEINKQFDYESDEAGVVEDAENYITDAEKEVQKGVVTINPAEWLDYWFDGAFEYISGEYRLLAIEVVANGEGYKTVGEAGKHTYTYTAPVDPVDPDAFPAEGVAYKFKNVDSKLYVKVIDDAEQCVTLGETPDEMYFTAVEGGWTISNSKGYKLGATAKGWNIGNTDAAIVWTIEEVEGGYAFKNEKGYLGYDTAAAGQKAFRDKNYTTHHGVFNIWKFDEEEPTPIEPDETLEETWANIKTLLAEAEAIKTLNEVTVSFDADGFFEDFTSPIVGKVGYKKHDDVWAVCDGADYVSSFVNYFETAEEAENYLADMGGVAGLEEIIKNVIDDYKAAEVVLPTPGKTYIIRNHPGEYSNEFSYAYYYNGEKLALSESANATTAEYMWTISEPVKYSYFDADLNVIEDTRYQFVNAADNSIYMAWRGNGTDPYNGVTTNASDANSKWYITGKKIDGTAAPAYGTLAIRTYADNNQYRTAVVDMRKSTDHLAKSNGDHFDATYSSWFIFEEVDEIPVKEWNGAEPVVAVEDDTTVKVTFTDAKSVEATNYGVLAAIYDEQGDVYGVVFNALFEDGVEFGTDYATLHFKKISEINAELAASAKNIAAKVSAAVEGVDVKGKVVICGKSFKIDGENLYTKVIVKDFDFNAGGTTTGINGIATESDAKVFDLQGRRVVAPAKGLFISEGRKVVK